MLLPPPPPPPRGLQHPFVQDYDGTEEMERLLDTYLSLEVETIEEPVCSEFLCDHEIFGHAALKVFVVVGSSGFRWK